MMADPDPLTRDYTTLSVAKSTHSRLTALKPYSSMSFTELLEEMADCYENNMIN